MLIGAVSATLSGATRKLDDQLVAALPIHLWLRARSDSKKLIPYAR